MKRILFIGLITTLIILSGCGGPGEYDAFANCLTEKNIKMYGTEWCSHCKEQKKRFGNSFQYVDYTDCDRNKAECLDMGIKGYPTWIIDGEKYPGTQQLERLSVLSGCELIKDV